MVSRFERHTEPHPLCEKPFRMKPSRGARIRETAERKKIMRKLMREMQ